MCACWKSYDIFLWAKKIREIKQIASMAIKTAMLFSCVKCVTAKNNKVPNKTKIKVIKFM